MVDVYDDDGGLHVDRDNEDVYEDEEDEDDGGLHVDRDEDDNVGDNDDNDEDAMRKRRTMTLAYMWMASRNMNMKQTVKK